MTLAEPIDTTLIPNVSEIVMPVDFSAVGWAALPLAKSLAHSLGAALRFLHVDTASPWRDEEAHQLTVTATPHEGRVEVDVIARPDPATGIRDYLARRDRALLAMTTHGHTPTEDPALGSVFENILRDSPGCLIAVGAKFDAGTHAKVSRIVACVSNNSDATVIVPDALGWARVLHVPLDVVTVRPREPALSADDPGVVDRVVKTITPTYSSVSGLTLVGSRPGHEIIRYATAAPGTLLAMSTHARSPLPRTIVGSVAMHVIRRTPTGILLRRYPDH